MREFRDLLAQDLRQVFFNTGEFAQVVRLHYCGNWYRVPAIISKAGDGDRERYRDDHVEGLREVSMTLRVQLADLGVVPKRDRIVTVEEEDYRVLSSAVEVGEIILALGRLDE